MSATPGRIHVVDNDHDRKLSGENAINALDSHHLSDSLITQPRARLDDESHSPFISVVQTNVLVASLVWKHR